MSKITSLDDLYIDGLRDAYDAETQLLGALPTIIEAANDPDLKRTVEGHEHETHGHLQRVEELFRLLGLPSTGRHSDGMAGLLRQVRQVALIEAEPGLIDIALIAAVQKIEHYEIANYGSLRTYALMLGYDRAHELLGHILDEEENTDMRLTELAESVVYPHVLLGDEA